MYATRTRYDTIDSSRHELKTARAVQGTRYRPARSDASALRGWARRNNETRTSRKNNDPVKRLVVYVSYRGYNFLASKRLGVSCICPLKTPHTNNPPLGNYEITTINTVQSSINSTSGALLVHSLCDVNNSITRCTTVVLHGE